MPLHRRFELVDDPSPQLGAQLDLNSQSVTGELVLATGQVNFPDSQNASSDANVLDDYEEGTWTPVVAGSSAAGSGSYSTQSGTYIKIGAHVTLIAWIAYSSHTGTGNLTITGLPFATSANGAAVALYFHDLTYSARPVAFVNSSTITFRDQASGGAATGLAMDAAATLRCTTTYSV